MFWWELDGDTWHLLAQYNLSWTFLFGVGTALAPIYFPAAVALQAENAVVAATFGYLHRCCVQRRWRATGNEDGSRGEAEADETEAGEEPRRARTP